MSDGERGASATTKNSLGPDLEGFDFFYRSVPRHTTGGEGGDLGRSRHECRVRGLLLRKCSGVLLLLSPFFSLSLQCHESRGLLSHTERIGVSVPSD